MTSGEQLPNRGNKEWHDDEEFIDRLQNGDELAWVELLEQHSERLRSDIEQSLRKRELSQWCNETDLDDIEEKTWLMVVRSIETFHWNGNGKIYNWIRKISLAVIYNYGRGDQSFYDEFEEHLPVKWWSVLHPTDDDVEAEAIEQATVAEIIHVMRQLKPREQDILISLILERASAKQLAQKYHVAEKTIYKIAQRAAESVRRYWELGNLLDSSDDNIGGQTL